MKTKYFFLKNQTYHKINEVNWPSQFSYKPETKFKVSTTEDSIVIHFIVIENHVKATCLNDMEDVYEDSCVEFFVKEPECEVYTNFEFNCIGTCYASKCKSKSEIVNLFTKNELERIHRKSSFGFHSVDNNELTKWELTVKIPFDIFLDNPIDNYDFLFVNFYKCGDKTQIPHYLSWNKINTPTPDFHRPEFFGKIFLNL